MATPEQTSDSLLAALGKARIPTENHDFIRRLTDAVGIVEYFAIDSSDKPYVVAKRRDGRPDLHIFYGYTTGFVSEDEGVRMAGGGGACRPSSRKGTWYVEHPVNNIRPGTERSRDIRRQAPFCTCGMQLSLTGVCPSCD